MVTDFLWAGVGYRLILYITLNLKKGILPIP